MEDFVTYYVCQRTAKRTNDWVLNKAGASRNLLESVKASKLFWTYRDKEVREFGEADNARNNTGISHKMQTESNMDGHSSMDWSMDTHWTRHSCILKTESSRDSSFMVRPSLGTRMAEGKARLGHHHHHQFIFCNTGTC